MDPGTDRGRAASDVSEWLPSPKISKEAAWIIGKAAHPVILLGLMASRPEVATAVRKLIAATRAPVVGTYQAAGAVSHDLVDRFGRRVGLFRNQHGDQLLQEADLVIAVGYNPVEYDPELWNVDNRRQILHIDVVPAELDNRYAPELELVGDIAATVKRLEAILRSYKAERTLALANAHSSKTDALHPLEIVRELAKVITPDVTTCLDMGAFHIWMERYLLSFRARQMLVSNGQQTMGVGLPRGIAASIVNPSQKVVSMSGDGGFMMSSMELETAVRLKCNLVHVVWVDQGYNMVEFQEQNKYGRGSGVDFGPIDFARYAQACGAKGVAVTSPVGLGSALRQAMEVEGPVVISVPVDYSQNHLLMEPRTTFGTVSTAA